VESGFDKKLHDIEVSFERGPVERVGLEFFGGPHHHSSILGFDFKILLSRSLRDEKFDRFCASKTAGPNEGCPFLFVVF
jgi:hypothetical protein